jgi:hypothetical protein
MVAMEQDGTGRYCYLTLHPAHYRPEPSFGEPLCPTSAPTPSAPVLRT